MFTLKRPLVLIASLLTMSLLFFSLAVSSQASAKVTTYPYDVTVAWQMPTAPADTPVNVKQNGPYLWPQSKLGDIPIAGCIPVYIQVDTYTIDSADDATYLAGLSTIASPADDARLHPHAYYAELLQDESLCSTPTPTPTVTVTPTPTPTESTTPPVSTTPVSTPTPSKTVPVVVPPTHKVSKPPVRHLARPVPPAPTPVITPVSSNQQLAHTGSASRLAIVLAVIFLLMGLGCLLLGRKPRQH